MSREELERYAASMASEVMSLKMTLNWYEEQFRLSRAKQFGASSEKTDFNQMSFFNEANSLYDTSLKEPEMTDVQPRKGRKAKGHKEKLTKPLPKQIIEYTLSNEERVCPVCGEELSHMKKEVRKELTVIPAKVMVTEHVIHSYSCRNCDKNSTEGVIVRAKAPEPLFRNSLASPSFLADIITKKYEDALPLYRQEQRLNSDGIRLSRQTLSKWIINASETYLKPLYDLMHKELLTRDVIHADIDKNTSLAAKGLEYCNALFNIEKIANKKGFSAEERATHRKKYKADKIYAEFIDWAKSMDPENLPKTKLKDALTYTVNQAIPVGNYLLDSRLEISNNRAERTIKPFVIGRKNWLFSNTPKGAQASSVLYSITQAVKECGLNVFRYLEYVFSVAPNVDMTDEQQLERLLPYSDSIPSSCKVEASADTNN